MPATEVEWAPLGGVWIVLPTFDEAANIEPISRAILAALPSATLLVVDDSSPDGTGEIAEGLAARDARIRVLHRPEKEGLGRAYLDGFRTALGHGADVVVQMDADFSHDPADLPRLLAAAEDADLVLGSRYIEGGGVTDWGLARRAISRWGSSYARTALGIGVHDLTGGFKLFRREVLEAIDIDSLDALGYAFQVETTFRAIRAGFKVVEVPIVFRDRRVGQSKMSGAIVVEAAWRVPAMRLRGR
jgi:dolichol-phosphate mannosyltransferase